MKLLRLSLFTMAATLLIGVFAPFSDVKAQVPAAMTMDVLKRMEANRKTLTSMRSNVRMEQYNSQIDDTDVREGTMMYLPNKNMRKPNLRIDWKTSQETLSVLDGKYKLYRPKLNMVYVGNAESKTTQVGGAFDFVNMSTAQLKQNFTSKWDKIEETKNGIPAYKLKLTPKNNSVSYSYAEIWVDDSGMPIQAKVIEKNKDYTIVSLSGIERNAKIDRKQFELKIPKGVEEVKT